MIPVEYPACGTALIAQEKPERTPEKYADKICHIEKRHEYQYDCFPDETLEIYETDEADEYYPDDKDRKCSESQCAGLILKGIYGPSYRWFEPFLEILLRTDRYIHPRRDQLCHDIYEP